MVLYFTYGGTLGKCDDRRYENFCPQSAQGTKFVAPLLKRARATLRHDSSYFVYNLPEFLTGSVHRSRSHDGNTLVI